jgi:hypothetical protein
MKTEHVIILGGIAAATVIYLSAKAAQTGTQMLQTIGDAVDPTNPDNIAAAGINKVGGVLVTDPTGAGKNADGSWTLGGWIYDVTHPQTVFQRDNPSNPITAMPW